MKIVSPAEKRATIVHLDDDASILQVTQRVIEKIYGGAVEYHPTSTPEDYLATLERVRGPTVCLLDNDLYGLSWLEFATAAAFAYGARPIAYYAPGHVHPSRDAGIPRVHKGSNLRELQAEIDRQIASLSRGSSQ